VAQCLGKCADVVGPDFDVGIDINPGEVSGSAIASQQGLTLGGNGNRQHPHRWPTRRSDLGSIICAAVGHDDHVKFAGACAIRELPKKAPDDPSLVVRGDDHGYHTGQVWTACHSFAGEFGDVSRSQGGWASTSNGSTVVNEARVQQTADVDERAILGPGTTVWHLAQIREDARLGSGCIVGRGAYVGPGVVIGNNVKLQNYALVYEPATLEDDVFIGPAAVLTNDLYPRSVDVTGKVKRPEDWEALGVVVRQGASLGARAVVVAGCVIGRWALVAAGAVVARDVPDFALAVGVPARRIGWVGRSGLRLADIGSGHWRCPQTGEIYREIDENLLLADPQPPQ
jgi:UDP-2-acetamido-3-amino-2,3-dideoxy-glucuronate N-acetyltransferase